MAEEIGKIGAQQVIRVGSYEVSCDGTTSSDPFGHPLVYLNLGEKGSVACPYCNRLFVFTDQSQFKG